MELYPDFAGTSVLSLFLGLLFVCLFLASVLFFPNSSIGFCPLTEQFDTSLEITFDLRDYDVEAKELQAKGEWEGDDDQAQQVQHTSKLYMVCFLPFSY